MNYILGCSFSLVLSDEIHWKWILISVIAVFCTTYKPKWILIIVIAVFCTTYKPKWILISVIALFCTTYKPKWIFVSAVAVFCTIHINPILIFMHIILDIGNPFYISIHYTLCEKVNISSNFTNAEMNPPVVMFFII